MPPTIRPLYCAPCASAASSTTDKSNRCASDVIGSMSTGCPYMCTGMMARVRDVIFASICETSMHHVRGSLSTRTGTARASMTANAQEIIVNVGMMTSAPGSNLSAAIATSSAVVPLLTATPYPIPQYAAHCCSNASMKRPSDDIQPVVRHSSAYVRARSLRSGSLTGITGLTVSDGDIAMSSLERLGEPVGVLLVILGAP